MWRKYFKLVKLIPGRVIVPGYGEIDFSKDNLPVELCMKLYESDFIYLETTQLGKEELYGLKIEKGNPEPDPPQTYQRKKRKRKNTTKTKPDTD